MLQYLLAAFVILKFVYPDNKINYYDKNRL